jgi:hypothetical protein
VYSIVYNNESSQLLKQLDMFRQNEPSFMLD